MKLPNKSDGKKAWPHSVRDNLHISVKRLTKPKTT